MIVDTPLLTDEERFPFDRKIIDDVAFPLGDRYPPEIFDRYFFYYSGLAHKYRPQRMLEIGVRYGYTGIVLCLAALAGGVKVPEYIGLDDESYHARSCVQANKNFAAVLGNRAQARAFKHNSFDGLPGSIGTFDLAHIDGNHDRHGVWNDLEICWPAMNVGGIVVLDDSYFPQIQSAINDWVARFLNSEEVVLVQWIPSERGHVLIQKTSQRVKGTSEVVG